MVTTDHKIKITFCTGSVRVMHCAAVQLTLCMLGNFACFFFFFFFCRKIYF